MLDLAAGGDVGKFEPLLFKLLERLLRVAADRAQALARSTYQLR